MATIQTLSLKTILVPSKSVTVEYPGHPNFKIDVSFLSRETLINLRKKATKQAFKGRQTTEEVNDDLFLQLYVDASIKGWKGLTLEILGQLAPIDVGSMSPDDELEYSQENALMLMRSSSDFDGFISETVTDLGNFQKSSKQK